MAMANLDPGGESSTPVEDSSEQLLIVQLRDVLRKEQSNLPQEKVEEYINTLMKVKRNKTKREDVSHSESEPSTDTNRTEKVNLLKQQLEENKAKLAERGKNQKGIEELLNQLKVQLNDSKQLISSVPITKDIAYDRNTSQEELYNTLLSKERKISELLSKTQKLEALVLDLQENVKEKDQVIDARTKAIALMTDSLSRKGKNTLDALDDTKEQMRQMQENFIKLEAEMKARQLKLLDDLKTKNLEIANLQGTIQQLQEEKNEENRSKNGGDQISEGYLVRINELENELQSNLGELNKWRSEATNHENELTKVKKQLDESNKNMIKLKAQSKNKIKELSKKINAFAKESDTNALLDQLQTQNAKLNEKIAELEEEKGNLQLKMVESTDSLKESDYKVLEEKLANSKIDIEEKDKIISFLEKDIINLKNEIVVLNESISNFKHLENTKVTSEIKSIQIEEQLDVFERENLKLKTEIELLIEEKSKLIEKAEEANKEKNELNSKLDNYIQENMELIDKLEKLSAEKVSSAESIEIVEGLTHQDKLEMAAEEAQKVNPELNESVAQLNEDSAELLAKIEMFNTERKEVMVKMEALKEENSRLNLKIQEIENNRDILAETYEQLQTEKEDLQRNNESLSLELDKLRITNADKESDTADPDASSAYQHLHEEYEKLLEENNTLKQTLKNFDSVIQEKDNLESELSNCRQKIDDLEAKLSESLKEIENYQNIIQDSKSDLIESASLINELQMKLSERENDIKDLNLLISDLNAVVSSLQSENEKLGNFEVMESQVEELKSALNKQIDLADGYAKEMTHNNEVITNLNKQLESMSARISNMEVEMDTRDLDIQKKKEIIDNLQISLKEKDERISLVVEDMKQKYLALQKKLENNDKIEELSAKNRELLEKMKKIAANLKKKTLAYQQLEEKYLEEKEKWETEDIVEELAEKTSLILEYERKILGNEDIIRAKEAELASYKERIRQIEGNILEITQGKAALEEQLQLTLQKYRELEGEMGSLIETSRNFEQTQMQNQMLSIKLKERQDALVEHAKKLEDLEKSNRELEEEIVGRKAIKAEDEIQINQLTQALSTSNSKLQEAHEEIIALKNETGELRKQLVYNIAEDTVNDIIAEAAKIVLRTQTREPAIEQEIIKSTTGGQSQSLPDDKIVTDDTKENLKEKVKALEFLLYNIDLERQDLLRECTGMVNELTHLVYDKVNKDVESQIITETDASNTSRDKRELQRIEFEQCGPLIGEQSQPVLEEVIQPKQAYLTYQPVNVEAFGENDDGWGWGPDEARMEEEYIKSSEEASLNAELKALREKVKVFQVERENHLEEIKQLQVKSGKLIKKCKELKQRNDQHEARKSQMLDLDETLQDELKLQITHLENKIKELSVELEKEKQAKSQLSKRAEVLTTANERMTEMKEIQDTEVVRWKRKYEEIEEKLKDSVWNSDGFTEGHKTQPLTEEELETIADLKRTIKDLAMDNEELQALLNEQRQIVIDAKRQTTEMEEKEQAHTECKVQLERLLEEKHATAALIDNYNIQILSSNNELDELKRQYDELETIKVSLERNELKLLEELENEKRTSAGYYDELSEQKWKSEKLEENENDLQKLKMELETVRAEKESSEKQVEELKAALDRTRTEYANLEGDLARITVDLEQKWQEQVDERGNTVAESWKSHLTTVETEFAVVQEQLKKELEELETRYNTLVNENNELRKNVDTEIKNEVDRISVLQRQIEDREGALQEASLKISEKEQEISSLKLVVQTTQKHLEEKREVVEGIARILERNTPWPLSTEKEIIMEELQRQLELISEKEVEINRLNSQLIELQTLSNVNQGKEIEIHALRDTVNELESKLAFMNEKDLEIARLIEIERQLQAQVDELTRKEEGEIVRLNEVIEEYKIQVENNSDELNRLHAEQLRMAQTTQDYEQKLMEFNLTCQTLQTTLEEKNQEIVLLNEQLKQQREDNRVVERLEKEIFELKQESSNLKGLLTEYQQRSLVMSEQLTEKTNELESMEIQLNDARRNTEVLENEITELKGLIENKEQEYNVQFESLKQTYLTDLEAYYGNILSSKELEIETVKKQLNEAFAEAEELKQAITEKDSEFKLQLDEKVKQSTELEEANQQQLLQLEQLQAELIEATRKYENLNTERNKQSTNSGEVKPSREVEDLSEPVSRAELDIALYMLHQRDVRCEELTMELTQLLEERDTLQLRLSNVIREKEDLRQRVNAENAAAAVVSEQEATTSSTDLDNEPKIDHGLATKLSELKSVSYKKDKTFVDEQEARRMQQMAVMQQHIQEASKLPAEAAAKLVDASYTLSRDVQSPSKVLLNWLWGRSIPKVNDT